MYLIFTNKEEAQKRNKEIAIIQGVAMEEDTTQFWFECIENTKTKEAALVISDETLITDNEKNNLIENINWFTNFNMPKI